MSPQEYQELVKKASPPSPFVKNFALAFLFGGMICALGEGLRQLYLAWGAEDQTSFTLVSVTLILLSVLLTGLGVYHKLAKYGGAGTLVPITGFANAMSCSAIEFHSEGWVLGLGAKMFQIAGPVIIYGISSSIIYGLIYYLFLK